MKIINIIIIAFTFSVNAYCQVPLTSIVEHFTNTSCSVCATRNPSIHNTIKSYPNTLHISFHPSSPYASDIFSQQNKIENDDRTKYYDVYGATPIVVLNGEETNSLKDSLATSSSLTSNYSVNLFQQSSTLGEFEVKVIIKKVATDFNRNALLFLGIIEDTIIVTTNNGEKVHYNVFRKSLTKTNGDLIILPASVGDSVVQTYNFSGLPAWDLNRIYTIGILQNKNKTVINSNKSKNSIKSATSVSNLEILEDDIFFPNPVSNSSIFSKIDIIELNIYNQLGKVEISYSEMKEGQVISLQNLASGFYFLNAKTKNGSFIQKILKQ